MITQTATISKKISGGDELVVIKKRDFDLFRRWQTEATVDQDFVEKRLKRALANAKSGQISKSYTSARSLVRSLKRHAR